MRIPILKMSVGCIAFSLLLASPSAHSQLKGGGINQLIETRSGKPACWGFVVHLHQTTFVDSLSMGQIKVVEAKHNRDITGLMNWSLDHTHKTLTVKFKPGKGDFGSGNSIAVTIEGAAIIGSPDLVFEWTITTDPL